MVGLNGIMLSEKYAKHFGEFQGGIIQFGSVYEHINGETETTTYLILGFLLVLGVKNSMHFTEYFKPNRFILMFTIILFLTAASMMSRVSEFLYFNF